jgi:hypothetical protein
MQVNCEAALVEVAATVGRLTEAREIAHPCSQAANASEV